MIKLQCGCQQRSGISFHTCTTQQKIDAMVYLEGYARKLEDLLDNAWPDAYPDREPWETYLNDT